MKENWLARLASWDTIEIDKLSDSELKLLFGKFYWFHSIELRPGVETKSVKTSRYLAEELKSLALPSLRDKTVLGIGAWDGFYSFFAEKHGAKRWRPMMASFGPQMSG